MSIESSSTKVVTSSIAVNTTAEKNPTFTSMKKPGRVE